MILDVAGVSFSYNSRTVLEKVRFRVQEGELMAILGPNGVGKTTLLKCINAILRPSRGSVLIGDENVLTLNGQAIARKIGYVAQTTQANRMSVFDAILMGRRPHINWKVSQKDLATVDGAIRILGLSHLSMRYIDQLSGGELQKVAIARALVQEPRLLLLDEPTSSLDLKNQEEILKIIRRVVREHPVGAVMTMHDLNTALRYADTFLFLKDGTIFSRGGVDEITPAMVEEIYGLPVEIVRHRGNSLIVPVEIPEKTLLSTRGHSSAQ